MSFAFGSFDYFCSQSPLLFCPLVGKRGVQAVEPFCYSRNIEIAGQLVFEPATLVIHFVALIMTGIMVYHIRSKYTAVGRREILQFFYMYAMVVILEFLLLSGIIATATDIYKYFVSAYIGLVVSTCWCLLLNGFIGFQWIEDGTSLSLWSMRGTCLIVFGISFALSLGTFQDMAGLNHESPFGLFTLYYIVALAMIIIYIIMQIVLVVNTLDDRWPLGDIFFGTIFFLTGKVFDFIIPVQICVMAEHYIDGTFFGTVCSLLSVMMVYKYWDSITREDLEFSVGGKSNVWELKDPLLKEKDEE